MTKEIITFSPDELLPFARAAFVRSCGFQADHDKHRRMSELAERALEDIIDQLNPTAIVSAFDGDALQGDQIIAGDVSFHCPLFSSFDPKHVEWIYAFMLTVGEFETSLKGITSTVFADMWGTVFCDAMVEALSDQLGAKTIVYPGFYGFPLSSVPQFASLLDSGRIGIRVHASYVTTPIKSCSGFMFASTEPLPLPENTCDNCSANKHWCIVCKKNQNMQKKSML